MSREPNQRFCLLAPVVERRFRGKSPRPKQPSSRRRLVIRFALPNSPIGQPGADGGEFEQRLARSWPRRCSLVEDHTPWPGAGPALDRSIRAARPWPPAPKLEHSGPPQGPRTSCLRPLRRRPGTNKKRRRELRLGGAPIQLRRLLFRSTNSRVLRLIFVVLEIDQAAVRDRGDVCRGLPGYSCFAGCRPSHWNKSVIVTVRPHNDLAGGDGRRNGHQSGSRGCDER